jgi:hypothetical protein
LILLKSVQGDDVVPAANPPTELRIFTIGNSFHAWLPYWLNLVEAETDIKGHVQVGISYISGSRAIVHWQVPDDKNKAKAALTAGNVDVVTVDAMLSPDEGIDDFATLGLQHNPNIRIAFEEFWLPYDRLDSFGEGSYGAEGRALNYWQYPKPDPTNPRGWLSDTSHFDLATPDQIEKLHALYFQKMDNYIAAENKKLGKQVIYVVPLGQAVVALRRLIVEGKAPGIAKQSELFADSCGHPKDVIMTLATYCFYTVIYHRSPVGLPVLIMPAGLVTFGKDKDNKTVARPPLSPELNTLLQHLALDAAINHPLSGCGDLKDNPSQ